MPTQKTAITKANNFIKEIKSLGVNLRRAILFGSFADNRQHEWSDIDLLLVADEFTGFGFEDRKLFSRINIKKEYIDIETKTYPTAYFKKGDPFIDHIKHSGIELKMI